jgi:hypothetical protein
MFPALRKAELKAAASRLHQSLRWKPHPRALLGGSLSRSLAGRSSTIFLTGIQHFSTEMNDLEDQSKIAAHDQIHVDFFGEPVTFLNAKRRDTTTNAMAALDGFVLAVITKGQTALQGGDEAGQFVRSAHAASVAWAEMLKHASVWNHPKSDQHAPMLAYIAVAPLIAVAGVGYMKHLDTLLIQAKPGAPGMPRVQMHDMALEALTLKDNPRLNNREQYHLEVLESLLEDDHQTALAKCMRILRLCPGDALALSMTMDLAQVCGDKDAAFRAAGSVVSYWDDRAGGFIKPSLPGHAMVNSLIALGFAVGGYHEYAEIRADRAMKEGRRKSGGLATWAQTHIFDARGGVAEGISALTNFDGQSNYEGAGLFHFDQRLGGWGIRFQIDREERGRGRSKALRMFDDHFDRILEYSGFAEGNPWQKPMQRAPVSWESKNLLEKKLRYEESTPSFLKGLLGVSSPLSLLSSKEKTKEDEDYELMVQDDYTLSRDFKTWEPTCEDVLTWIPPMPQLLSDATLLMLRLTLNGTISRKNFRWDNLRRSWESMLDIQKKHGATCTFCPLAVVSASMVLHPSETGGDRIGNGRLAQGLYMMGQMLEFGNVGEDPVKEVNVSIYKETVADSEPDFWFPVKEDKKDQWKEIVFHLASAIDGIDHIDDGGDGRFDQRLQFKAWTFDSRPILEHAVVFASCKTGDIECLSLARSICSQGVALRPMSPEEWWRYSIVLGLLGDQVASEEAYNYSVIFGGGQGAKNL